MVILGRVDDGDIRSDEDGLLNELAEAARRLLGITKFVRLTRRDQEKIRPVDAFDGCEELVRLLCGTCSPPTKSASRTRFRFHKFLDVSRTVGVFRIRQTE